VQYLTRWSPVLCPRWELRAYAGSDPDGEGVLSWGGRRSLQLMTSGDAKANPRPEQHLAPPRELSLTWLLQHLSDDLTLTFGIDRQQPKCRTPRRNAEVDAALRCGLELARWCEGLHGHWLELASLRDALRTEEGGGALDVQAVLHAKDVFVPVVPLFRGESDGDAGPTDATVEPAPEGETGGGGDVGTQLVQVPAHVCGGGGGGDGDGDASSPPSSSPLLRVGDINMFLAEQRASLQRKRAALIEAARASPCVPHHSCLTTRASP
jgi:hypothetical protein